MLYNNLSQTFVSVVTIIKDSSNIDKKLQKINMIESLLSKKYSDYEILLIVQKKARSIANKIESQLKITPCIRYIQLSGNVETDIQWSSGLENSIGDFIVLFDLEMDPVNIIFESVELCKKGYDIIIGICKQNESKLYALFRDMSIFLLSIADYRVPRHATTFRCLSRRAANAVMETGHFHQPFFLRIQNTGYTYKEIYYSTEKIHIKHFKEGLLSLIKVVVFNSVTPLRLMTVVSFIGSIMAFFFALYSLFVQFFSENVVAGWTSTTLIISVLFIFQFIILSFISEYLIRLLEEHKNTSLYSVVFEKNSLVMINQDRINVLDNSTSEDTNLVQTARNK